MFSTKFKNITISFLFTLNLLFLTLFLLGATKKQSSDQTLIKPGIFADLRVAIVESPEKDKQCLALMDDEEPFCLIFKDNSNKLSYFLIVRDDSALINCGINSGKLARVLLRNNDQKAIFMVDYDQEKETWFSAIYGGSDNDGSPLGEMYLDLNYDGHFDVIKKYVHKGKEFLGKIYIDDMWLEVDAIGSGSDKAGKTMNGEKMVFAFDYMKGWRKIGSINKKF